MAYEILDEQQTREEIKRLVQNADFVVEALQTLLLCGDDGFEASDNLEYVYEQILVGLYGGQVEKMGRPKILETLLNVLPVGLVLCKNSKEIVQKEEKIVKMLGLEPIDLDVRAEICNCTCSRIQHTKLHYADYKGDPLVIDIDIYRYGTQESMLAAMIRAGLVEEQKEKE